MNIFGWKNESKEMLEAREKGKEDKERISSCDHIMETVESGIDNMSISAACWKSSYGQKVFTIIRCKKSCGFIRRIYEE